MNRNAILQYLNDLEQNNNRDWYHIHKAEREIACGQFEEIISELMLELRRTDKNIPIIEPKELTFKLVRDTRFSHDKSPYNPSFRAHIAPKGKQPVPVGYFLMIKPGGGSFLGGGLFTDVFKDATKMIRDYIASHGEEWQNIITDQAFAQHFTVKGTSLKKVPQGYDPNCPQAEYLKYKSWYLEYPVADTQLLDKDFMDYITGIFIKMQKFNSFLNSALADFQMPQR